MGGCCWHLVGRGQGWYSAQAGPQMLIVLRLTRPAVESHQKTTLNVIWGIPECPSRGAGLARCRCSVGWTAGVGTVTPGLLQDREVGRGAARWGQTSGPSQWTQVCQNQAGGQSGLSSLGGGARAHHLIGAGWPLTWERVCPSALPPKGGVLCAPK